MIANQSFLRTNSSHPQLCSVDRKKICEFCFWQNFLLHNDFSTLLLQVILKRQFGDSELTESEQKKVFNVLKKIIIELLLITSPSCVSHGLKFTVGKYKFYLPMFVYL